jgi:nucleoside phosphorylase
MLAIQRGTIDPQEFIENYLRQNSKVNIDDLKSNDMHLKDVSFSPEEEKEGKYDVLVVCALPEEREQLFDAFGVSEEDKKRTDRSFRADYNFVYHKFSYSGFNIAVVTQNAMGMAAATSLVTRAILAMRPNIVAMTGICAGRKGKVELGDILIADQVYDYTAGKRYIDKFSRRPLAFTANDDIRNYVTAEILNKDQIGDSIVQAWRGTRINRRISIHMKTVASGTAVIDDEQTLASAAEIQDNLYGIDMEAYGVAVAAVALETKWVVIKAVQDYADGNKTGDESGIRAFAAYASASLLKKMIPDIIY